MFGGWVLYEALLRAAMKKGEEEAALCNALAVTKGYFNMIGTGTRHANTLSDEFFRACSSYLEIPYLLVQIIAGRISEQDLLALGSFAEIDVANILKAAKTYTTSAR
ncbi:MAG: hypothetical protein EAZ11_10410 [Curvibacter sp.]|nr:MAG: hypothetical protein EAZ11_10410 [Curvibacter sp.]